MGSWSNTNLRLDNDKEQKSREKEHECHSVSLSICEAVTYLYEIYGFLALGLDYLNHYLYIYRIFVVIKIEYI